jgi:hypothetical protein
MKQLGRIWWEIESALARFGGDDADIQELRALADKLPSSLVDVPGREREKAQELGAEALYRAGRHQRVITWAQPCLGPATAHWIGHALFDLGRPAAALPHFRAGLQRPLPTATRAKLEELILCCRITCEPDAVTIEDLQGLRARYDALGAGAPTAAVLRQVLARRGAWPSFSVDLVRAAQSIFSPVRVARITASYGPSH